MADDGIDILNELSPFPSPELSTSFAFAQHYGIPTRFLDFSESPYVALFFAAYNTFIKDILGKDTGYMVVNCLSINTVDYLESLGRQLQLVKVPWTTNTNLHRQKGVFVSLDRASSYYYKNKRWPSVEDLLLENNGKELLKRIIIPKKMSREILRRLFDFGVTPCYLIPSIENISKHFAYTKQLFITCGYKGEQPNEHRYAKSKINWITN